MSIENYSNDKTFFHLSKKYSTDPRTKLVILSLMLFSIFFFRDWIVLLSLTATSVLFIILVKPKIVFLIRFILFLLVFSALATFFAYRSNSAIDPFEIFAIISSRFLTTFFIITWFFSSVQPYELAVVLEKMYVPTRITWFLTTIYQFIPILTKEAQTINEIRKLKGLTAKMWQFKKQVIIIKSTLKPLISGTMNKAIDLAEAMTIKGFQPNIRREHIVNMNLRIYDYILILVMGTSLICLIIFVR